MIFTSLLMLLVSILPPPLDLSGARVAHLTGVVDQRSELRLRVEMLMTSAAPGDRILMINSPGGEVEAGRHMIELLENERTGGIRLVCIVEGAAMSMAFNILSHCDVRLATANSKLLAHKIALGGLPAAMRLTAKTLRGIAREMEKEEEPFRWLNAKAMHLSLQQYDRYADAEKMWTPQELLDMKYLDGIVGFTILP